MCKVFHSYSGCARDYACELGHVRKAKRGHLVASCTMKTLPVHKMKKSSKIEQEQKTAMIMPLK